MYFDTSNLNARYDYTPPLQGLGGGSLSTGGLGSLGAASALGMVMPWMEQSADTLDFQRDLNGLLTSSGYCAIAADGVLGPATCGAAKWSIDNIEGMEGQSPPVQCESFTAPQRQPCGGGGGAAARPTTPVLQQRTGGGGTNFLLIGGIVAAVAIGGAIMLKKKKGR
jgi:hypothetical protein